MWQRQRHLRFQQIHRDLEVTLSRVSPGSPDFGISNHVKETSKNRNCLAHKFQVFGHGRQKGSSWGTRLVHPLVLRGGRRSPEGQGGC